MRDTITNNIEYEAQRLLKVPISWKRFGHSPSLVPRHTKKLALMFSPVLGVEPVGEV